MIRSIWKKNSINRRFVSWCAVTIAGTLIVFSFGFVAHGARSSEEDLRMQAEHMLSLSVQSLSNALWNYNHDYVNAYVDALFVFKDIVFANVVENANIVKSETRDGYLDYNFDSAYDSERFLVLESDIFHHDENVGTIRIAWSKEKITRQILENCIAVGLVFLIVVSVVSLTLYLLFREYILDPLVALDNSARLIADGDLGARIDVSSEDEIGKLARTFSRMMQNIKAVTASKEELNREIAERKRVEKAIGDSLREKEILLKEVHHRVKNNMQIIQSLLNIQAEQLGQPEFKKALVESNTRIKSMALVHETLYRSNNMANLDMKAYFENISKHLLRLYRKPGFQLELSVDVDPVELDLDHCIACGLIINELISNSLKYAFVDLPEGRLEIELRRDKRGEARLTVSDNGKGVPDSFDWRSDDSMGLKIVRILVEGQLKGSLSLRKNNGASFSIAFPIRT